MVAKRSFLHPMTKAWLHAIRMLSKVTRIFERQQLDFLDHLTYQGLGYRIEMHTYGPNLGWHLWYGRDGHSIGVKIRLWYPASAVLEYDAASKQWKGGYEPFSKQEMTPVVAKKHKLLAWEESSNIPGDKKNLKHQLTNRQAMNLLRDIAKIVKKDQQDAASRTRAA